MGPLVRQSFHSSVQHVRSGLEALNQLYKDPEFFQRICQVAIVIFQGISWYRDKVHFPKWCILLDAANFNDFYDVIELPYTLLHTYGPDRIDTNALLDNLEKIVIRQCLYGITQEQKAAIRERLRSAIQSFHEDLEENDVAFSTPKEYKNSLQEWLKQDPSICHLHSIDLTHLEVALTPTPLVKKLSTLNNAIANIGCVLYFLQEWQVVDLASKAASLGQFPLLSWLQRVSLEKVIYGSLSLYYLCEFLDAWRILRMTTPSPEAARNAKWDRVTAAAEFVFNFAAFRGADPRIVLSFMFIAKMLGLVSITDRFLRSRRTNG